jgi:flavin-dependent thymidylate synthase
MKVTLAGATLDKRFWPDHPSATPETISAAYARISHSPRSIGSLRDTAVDEVDGARKSNENIVYRMGHSSIAEHAVFNIDIEDASRLLVEFLEHHRLASFTERSQRYVFFGNKELQIPPELKGSEMEEEVRELESGKFELYNQICGMKSLKEKYGDKLLEQARYVLGLTCPTDIGMTVNARELEYIISRGGSHELAEVRELSDKLLQAARHLAPSLIKYTDADDHERRSRNSMSTWIVENLDRLNSGIGFDDAMDAGRVSVCSGRPAFCDDPESEVAAALLFELTDMDLNQCRRTAMEMTDDDLLDFLRPVFSEYPLHSSLPRPFEMMDLTFDFDISASGFAQLKRHRMATILVKDYEPSRWFTPPVFLEDPDLAGRYVKIMRRSESLHERIQEEMGTGPAQYVLTNAHMRKVIFKSNLRELYHFVRLRSDIHAQDEIRNISDRIVSVLKGHFPVVTAMLCGKDSFEEGKERIYGCDSIR